MKNVDDFIKQITRLLDEGNYEEAKQKLLSALENIDPAENDHRIALVEIAGFLIDIGSEALDKQAANTGVDILKNNEEYIKEEMTEQSYNYCLGNGMTALSRIENANPILTLENVKPYLTSAKNYYFKAFKEIDYNDITKIDLEILTNLGNNLAKAGRVVESVRIFKSVIKEEIKIPQALIGYADNLHRWIKISHCPESISLYVEIYMSYLKGLELGAFPPAYAMRIRNSTDFYKELLEEIKFDFSTIQKELEITKSEYSSHNVFRKFCIDNFLVLNEHSLFCNCIDVAKDDLSIVHSKISLYGEKVGKMELLLNRLKSEFNLARKLYHEGISVKEDSNEMLYSDLMDGEQIGDKAEKVRTSFRLCFGIFDKIAHGICYFFDLPKRDKPFYFDTFWDEDKRWQVLKNNSNPHLIALFSIANDLKGSEEEFGEFGFYKHWRNKLEHRNLILLGYEGKIDFLGLFDDGKFVTEEPFWFFKEQALHLLQMCCAAIYSYTYCIRIESLRKDESKASFPFIIQPKNY